MTPAFRHSSLPALVTGALLLLSVATGVTGYFHLQRLRVAPSPAAGGLAPRPTLSTNGVAGAWSVFLTSTGTVSGAAARSGPVRLRLAGTFCVNAGGETVRRRAVIESPARKEQYIVGEGDMVEDVTVVTIYVDRVAIRTHQGMDELRLDFAGKTGATDAIMATATNQSATSTVVAVTNRFGGTRVSENRWEFKRGALVAYYQELLEEPARMVSVFDSLKPVRNDAGKITGYVLGMEGEKEFFDAIGLQEGDVVRKANSMDMNNRRRAEYLIDEFLKSRLNVVVLEIERSGTASKLIYSVRP